MGGQAISAQQTYAEPTIVFNNTQEVILKRVDHKDLDTAILAGAAVGVLLLCFIVIISCYVINQIKYN